ncbi:MAG: SDR family oxidoreductase [Candidatus Micrarchaeota archaeon]
MKILVLGGSGLLGRELVSSLAPSNEVTYTYFNNPGQVPGAKGYALDLADLAATERLMDGIAPEVVLHTVAPPSVDWHEREHAAAYATNVLGTRAIAEKAKKMGAKLVYISTTFVFPDAGRTFTEEDIPAPINFYGVTKWGAELAAAINPNHAIIRTDQIYGWSLPGQKKSFVVSTLEKLEKGQKAEVCSDWLNSPTYVKDLSLAVKGIMEKDKRGIYHVVGNSFLDRVSWARKIAAAFGKDPSLVVGIESSGLKLPARRPNARVSNEKAKEELGLRLRTVDEGLEDMLGSRP